jgi:hypothetical protein
MNTDATGAATFEYGIVRTVSAVVANASPPTRLGTADAESRYAADGTITIVVAVDEVGGPEPGDLIGGLVARTYPVAQDQTLRGDTAADAATFAATYGLVGNASCEHPAPTVTCLAEDDARVAYSRGWHEASDPDARDGAFRFNTGRDAAHGLSLAFEVPEGASGALVYHFARSPKGGRADVYVDGAFRETIGYAGPDGTTRNPGFGSSARYDGLGPGAHTFELRNVRGIAYVDGFCLESAFGAGPASSGPGATSSGVQVLGVAQSALQSVGVPSGASAVSVAAVSETGGSFRVVLVSPAGAALAIAESSEGVAALEAPVAQAGVYTVQVVNLGPAPLPLWTSATPFGPR